MSDRGVFFFSVVLATALLLCAGCISPSPSAGTPATPLPVSTIPTTAYPPATTITPTRESIPAVTSPAETPVSVTPTLIPKSYGQDALDSPYILLLTFAKEWMSFDIPDCGMQVAFPQVAGKPGYGIREPEPELVIITPEEMDSFIKTYEKTSNEDPSKKYIEPYSIGGAQCAGVPANPKWNFVRVNATLMPRNARPGEYDIGINIRSKGNIIEQLRLNRTFVLDEPIIFVWYIPLRIDEMDDFDSIDLVFSRRK